MTWVLITYQIHKNMISKKEYLSAKSTVERYEKEQLKNKFSIEKTRLVFPIGTLVKSKLNKNVTGMVYDYTDWAGTTQLLCHTSDGGKTRILVTNAVRV